jgi:hypothetical protein
MNGLDFNFSVFRTASLENQRATIEICDNGYRRAASLSALVR